MTQCPSLLATELGDGPLFAELDDGDGLIPEKIYIYIYVINNHRSSGFRSNH